LTSRAVDRLDATEQVRWEAEVGTETDLGGDVESPRPAIARASDAELLAGCRNGDPDAWDELVSRYERLVFSVALRNGLSREDACDVTQTTFVFLLESLVGLREDEKLASWLMTVSRRQAWRVRRSNDRQLELAEPTERSNDLDGWERVVAVHQALHETGMPCRELLTYLYFDPTAPSYAEVARRMGRSIGTIGPMRARCLQRLRTALGEDGPHL